MTFAVACQEYDLTSIWDKLNEHEARIEELETLCRRLNTNVESLQSIVAVLQSNDHVTDIVKIMENGVEVGYSITFAKSGTVTLYHGANAAAPTIGVKKTASGEYYWTINGEWLTDENGSMISATVLDPSAGYITPQFRVADDIWYISYDNGNTWRISGDYDSESEYEGDSLFKSVKYDGEYVCFTLADDSKIVIPIIKNNGNHWDGKIWYAYGTSLTSESLGKYVPYVAKLSGLNVVNKGIGGGGIVSNTKVKDAVMNITDGKLEADLITLEVGANDASAELGNPWDNTSDTFLGSLTQCINYLLKNTNAQVVVMSSPIGRYTSSGGSTEITPDRYKYLERWQGIRDVCIKCGVYYIGLADEAGMGWARLNNNMGVDYNTDNIHHTDIGGYNLALYMWSELKDIPCWYTSIPEDENVTLEAGVEDITSEFLFTKNTSITAQNGVVATSTRIMKSSDYVNVQNASQVTLSFMTWTSSAGSTSGYGLAFYNSDRQFVSGYGFPKADEVLGNSAGASYMLTIDVPKEAVYLRTTYHADESVYGSFVARKTLKIANSESIKPNFPPYNAIGSPHIYITDWADKDKLSVFANVDELNAAYEELAKQYPRWFRRNEDIGEDATGTYQIRHYTLGMLNPSITSDRAGETENLWSDTAYPRRRILLNANIHGWSERFACYGAYLTVKEILSSNDEWALFIKNNLVLEVVPTANPWGYDNKTSNNAVGKNLNRTYFNDLQQENESLIGLIDKLIPMGLCGVVDYHNTGDQTPGYLVAKPSYSHWTYYATLAAQLESISHDSFLYLEGEDRPNFFHLWDATGNNGQLHQYADHKGLLGCTFEVSSSYGSNGSLLSKMLGVNLINAFGTYVGD